MRRRDGGDRAGNDRCSWLNGQGRGIGEVLSSILGMRMGYWTRLSGTVCGRFVLFLSTGTLHMRRSRDGLCVELATFGQSSASPLGKYQSSFSLIS